MPYPTKKTEEQVTHRTEITQTYQKEADCIYQGHWRPDRSGVLIFIRGGKENFGNFTLTVQQKKRAADKHQAEDGQIVQMGGVKMQLHGRARAGAQPPSGLRFYIT